MPTTPRRWYQFSLRTMFVLMTLVAFFVAVFQTWGIVITGVVGIELGLAIITIMMVRHAGRLEQSGRQYVSLAVGLIGMLSLVLALIVFMAAMVLSSLSGRSY